MDEQPQRDLVDRWRQGDEQAANDLYQTYLGRMSQLVSQHMSQRFASRIDPDDVVHSAYRTFFRRVKEGEFQFEDDADIWKLLLTIALNKVRNRVRFHSAAKRDAAQEVSGDLIEREVALHGDSLSRHPSPHEAIAFADLLEEVYGRLDEREQLLLQLRLEGYKQTEIADELGLTDRTIRRMLDRIRERLSDLLQPPAASEPSDASNEDRASNEESH